MPEYEKILSYGDMFGVTPKLFIDYQTRYKTRFGSFLSLLLFILVIIACWVYGNDIYYRKNPNSIFTEESTTHPEKFKIDQDSLNFCFGLQDRSYQHFFDPTIYQLKLFQFTETRDDNGSKVDVVDLNARQCRQSDFGVAKDFFQKISYEKLYCMDNYKISNIEGDYGADTWSMIQGYVSPCRNSTDSEIICQSQEVIDETLKDNYWAFYFTDQIVNPKNYDLPFKEVGRSTYGLSSSKMFRSLAFYFKNIYLDDNTGIIFDSWNYKRGLQYTQDQTMIKAQPQDNGDFIEFLIRFEKVKQTRIYRTYLNLAQVLANVGGVLKVFMLSFLVISSLIGDQLYNKKLANSLFQFKYRQKLNNNSKKQQLQNQQNSEQQQQSDNQKEFKPKELQLNSIFNLFCTRFQKKHIQVQKQMLDYSFYKLGYHLDIRRLLQKMIEIDKLKMLLLNEQQMNLFEYLPKPVITEEMIEQIQVNKQNNIEIEAGKKKEDISKGITKRESVYIPDENFFEDIRTEEQKEQDAFKAFKALKRKGKQGKIDQRILGIMDKNLKEKFEEKSQDYYQENYNIQVEKSCDQSYRDDLVKQSSDKFNNISQFGSIDQSKGNNTIDQRSYNFEFENDINDEFNIQKHKQPVKDSSTIALDILDESKRGIEYLSQKQKNRSKSNSFLDSNYDPSNYKMVNSTSKQMQKDCLSSINSLGTQAEDKNQDVKIEKEITKSDNSSNNSQK